MPSARPGGADTWRRGTGHVSSRASVAVDDGSSGTKVDMKAALVFSSRLSIARG